jgi:hypothetical protein
MEHDPTIKAKTSRPFYQPSWVQELMFPPEAGVAQVWQRDLAASPLGEYWTRNTSGFHKGAAVSLSSVLEPAESIPEKYFLSPKACLGILRRAAKRGKQLPHLLLAALESRGRAMSEQKPSS